jgi:outer membrane murein-binding lipoprotein Lpp
VHEGLLKNQKIDALSSEVSTLAEQIEEDQLQINTLKHQVANLINQGVS